MSGYLQGQVWFRDVRGSDREVLLALADHADDDGTRIYPSMDYLAWKVGLTKRRVQQVVSGLRNRGVLIVVREATRYEPTHYRMDLGALPEKPERPGVQSVSSLDGRGEISGPSGVKSGDVRGETQASPEPSRETSEETSEQAGGACAKVALPEGFPEELRPHLRSVYRVLRDLAARHEAREVKPLSLASVVVARPRKRLVKSAHDYAAWADGRSKRVRDVVSGYRNWLDNEEDFAVIERLDERGMPAGRVNGQANGSGGLLKRQVWPDGRTFDELTPREQANAREAVMMGGRPWEAGRDAALIVPSGEVVTAAGLAAEIAAENGHAVGSIR